MKYGGANGDYLYSLSLQIVEEDPLNSDDDDQDDEELDTIFDADHIIMCLFEKVLYPQ